MSQYDTFIPEGFSTVTPYIFSDDAPKLLAFLAEAFDAKEELLTIHPETGAITNAIVRIGKCKFMVSQARDRFLGMKGSFYLYTEQPDELFAKALAAGGVSLYEPNDMEYGDRQGGITDPCGNFWWISKRLVKSDYTAD